MSSTQDLRIEPERGAEYRHDGKFAVYSYDVYPEGSVLAGQERRRFVAGGFTSEAAAKAACPEAVVQGGSCYREIPVPHTPPAWFDPGIAGETWDNDDDCGETSAGGMAAPR
jgi:hypothetical protein